MCRALLRAHLLDCVQDVVLQHVLKGCTLGLAEQLLDCDAVSSCECWQTLQPSIICGSKNCDCQGCVIEIACMSSSESETKRVYRGSAGHISMCHWGKEGMQEGALLSKLAAWRAVQKYE